MNIEDSTPAVFYETVNDLAVRQLREKEDVIVTTMQKLGINTEIVVQQQRYIDTLASAIRRVRNLHQPFQYDGTLFCTSCVTAQGGEADYPCQTIKVLDGELA